MKLTKSIYLIVTIAALCQANWNFDKLLPIPRRIAENAKLDFTGLATKYGHPPVRYEVITEDGYILTLFRLPGRSKRPILLVHGLLDTSDTWVIRGNRSLGITLANDGYDVWCVNSRGNRYSRAHVSLDPDKDASYWNWTLHDLGHYDLPAVIDTILNETRTSSLTAIGHSRGNAIFYILGSTRKEYNSKINVMIALAPVAYLHHSRPPASIIIEALPFVYRIFKEAHVPSLEFFGYNRVSTRLLRDFCRYMIFGPELCVNFILFPLTGFDPIEIEPSFGDVIFSHFPAGSSWKDLLHFWQLRSRREFAQFDYGSEQNQIVYNSPTPPRYNLTQVDMPIALFVGRNDLLSTISDVTILRDQLPNVVDYKISRRSLMDHFDYTWGWHMSNYLFPDIYRILKQYNEA